MKQDHRPWKLHTFNNGANTDADGAVVANAEGTYRDAQNMRPVDDAGGNGKLNKVGGEQVKYPANVRGASNYVCIGTISVAGHMVEFWASNDASYPPLIRIDGIVMAMSAAIPYSHDKPLQLHKSEDCEGGMVFDARSGAIPIHWDIGHIISEYNTGNQTYFSDFDPETVYVNPTRPVSRPRFKGLEDVGQGSGIEPGVYAYSLRFVNGDGDRTPEGPFLENVVVPWLDIDAWDIPSAGVVGAEPGQAGTKSKWGVKLVFRVNNAASFESVELIRRGLVDGTNIEQEEVIKVVERWPVSPGVNVVMEYTDTGEAVDDVTGDEASIQTFYIKSANSVRYVRYRVVYGGVEIAPREIHGTYHGNNPLFPVTKSIGTKGHADAVNHCYHRRFQSGERYGFGTVFHLPDGSTSNVDPIGDVQMPNRRDPKTGESLQWSDAPCYAATTNCQPAPVVGPSFEVFDHDEATAKSRMEGINVMQEGRKATGSYLWSPVVTDPSTGHYISNDGGSTYHKFSWGRVLGPRYAGDYTNGLDTVVNNEVNLSGYNEAPQKIPYSPKVFNVRHHTLGIALRGIDRPQGVQGFSVVSTKPAGRVVAQGLGRWVLKENLGSSTDKMASKELNKIAVTFPEYGTGGLSQQDYEAMVSGSNAGGYALQIVSPLGWASEVYGSMTMRASAGAAFTERSFLCDMMSYARVLWDTGQINPGSADGINAPTGAGTAQDPMRNYFVGFGKWRGSIPASSPWSAISGNDGNVVLQAQSAYASSSDLPGTVTFVLDQQPVYGHSWGGSGKFSDPDTKNFHEPWYVVNVIKVDVDPDGELGYVGCNHYQAFETVIGTASGNAGDAFDLADEREADYMGRTSDGIERYIHIKGGGASMRYVNAEGLPDADINAMLASIASNGDAASPYSGETVQGLFRVEDGQIILLNAAPARSSVIITYDDRIPVVAYGDRVTSPSLARIVDGTGYSRISGFPTSAGYAETPWGGYDMIQALVSIGAPSVGTQPDTNPYINVESGILHTMGCPIGPFTNYVYPDWYYVPFGMGYGLLPSAPEHRLSINPFRNGRIHSVRQWLALFDCEVKDPGFMSMYNAPTDRTFPTVNYVPRPYNVNNQSTWWATENGLHANYTGASGLYPEPGDFGKGGFYTQATILPPYRITPRVRYFELPEFQKEDTDLCNALVWSERKSPLQSDLPALKTFPLTNVEFVENDTGTIQLLYSKEDTLYAVMEKGIYGALIERAIMSSPDGQDLSMYAATNFIGSVVNISKGVGMSGVWWRTAAEGSVIGNDGARRDALMWMDGISAYRLTGNAVQDIAKGRYRKGLASGLDPLARTPYRLYGAYDQSLDELHFGMPKKVLLYAKSPGTDNFYGSTTHDYDRMLFHDGAMYGMRDLTTYLMDEGSILNGSPVEGWVKVASAPYPGERMAWLRVKVDSPLKPRRIEFYDENDIMVCWMDDATFGPFYLKKETVWEHWVPKDRVTYAPSKGQMQGRLAYAKVIFTAEGEESVAYIGLQAKPLK